MKAAKLAAEKQAEIKSENTTPAKEPLKKENKQFPAEVNGEEKRKLPWELVFLFVVMGITILVIALKAFSII